LTSVGKKAGNPRAIHAQHVRQTKTIWVKKHSSWVVRRIHLISVAIRNPEEPVCTVRFVRMDFTLSVQPPRFRPRNVTINMKVERRGCKRNRVCAAEAADSG